MSNLAKAISAAGQHHVRIMNKTIVKDVDVVDLSVGKTVVIYVNPLIDSDEAARKITSLMEHHGLTD